MTHTDQSAHIPLVSGRSCGDCTACCKILNIDEPSLKKPPGVLCQHVKQARCSIHPSRPQSCRDFHCLWRQVPTMPDTLRPDRIGVMFTIEGNAMPSNPFEREYVIGRAINGKADFETAGAKATLQVFVSQGDLPIWLSAGGERTLHHPQPRVRDAILAAGPPPPDIAADVMVWRKRLGLD
jgi:hypothetical protein